MKHKSSSTSKVNLLKCLGSQLDFVLAEDALWRLTVSPRMWSTPEGRRQLPCFPESSQTPLLTVAIPQCPLYLYCRAKPPQLRDGDGFPRRNACYCVARFSMRPQRHLIWSRHSLRQKNLRQRISYPDYSLSLSRSRAGRSPQYTGLWTWVDLHNLLYVQLWWFSTRLHNED